VISYEQGYRKVGRKCRRGRRSNPVGHRGHRKPRGESRIARLLKRELMLRSSQALDERDVFARPVASGVHVQVMLGAVGLVPSYREAPRTGVTAAGQTHEERTLNGCDAR
jgi:hypothetical protein